MSQLELPQIESQALALARTYVATHSIAELARLIDYNRSAASCYLAGKYSGNVANVEAAILNKLARVSCPYLKCDLPMSECHAFASAKPPKHHPLKLEHWRACQRCPKKPEVV